MAIITFCVGVLAGYLVCALISKSETEGESFWRTQYYILKNEGKDEL